MAARGRSGPGPAMRAARHLGCGPRPGDVVVGQRDPDRDPRRHRADPDGRVRDDGDPRALAPDAAHRAPPRRQDLADERRAARDADAEELRGATVGIVGYGRIGREISRLAEVFGMNVLGVSRSGRPPVDAEKFDTGRRSVAEDRAELFAMDRLDEVLRRSDFLVVVVPLTELTRGMIGAQQLDLLPPGAHVINIARGGIVDESALLERVRDGRIAGVALDVFDDEPLPPTSAWWSEPNALVTPHVAGLAPQYHAQTLDLVVENLTRLAENRPIVNEVDRAAGY
ncbi:NAD(P)-dependent oxidoreductase [Agromyces marinus]|uniref:NAD(P)-dependent oxidoreductase n=1 Tax=Agromyces marinus TaxID=1389020 RepID=UPI003306249B